MWMIKTAMMINLMLMTAKMITIVMIRMATIIKMTTLPIIRSSHSRILTQKMMMEQINN